MQNNIFYKKAHMFKMFDKMPRGNLRNRDRNRFPVKISLNFKKFKVSF